MNELMKGRLLSVCLSVTYVFRQETNVQTTTKAGLLSALAGMACKAAAMALLVQDPWRVVHWWVWSGALLGMGPASEREHPGGAPANL